MKPPILMDFPESFETERLLIRSPLPGDGPELHAAVRESIEELTPWMTWPKEHRTVDDSEASARRARVAFLQRSELRMHLYLKGTDTLVGSSGLQGIDWEVPKFEIGYWCRTRFTGQGYITEAVRGITAFAFDTLGAKRVEIRCDSRNNPSVRVAQHAGFLLEGELRNNEVGTDGGPRDTLIYAMTSADACSRGLKEAQRAVREPPLQINRPNHRNGRGRRPRRKGGRRGDDARRGRG